MVYDTIFPIIIWLICFFFWGRSTPFSDTDTAIWYRGKSPKVSILDGVGQHAEGYDEVLLAIGGVPGCARPEAVRLWQPWRDHVERVYVESHVNNYIGMAQKLYEIPYIIDNWWSLGRWDPEIFTIFMWTSYQGTRLPSPVTNCWAVEIPERKWLVSAWESLGGSRCFKYQSDHVEKACLA